LLIRHSKYRANALLQTAFLAILPTGKYHLEVESQYEGGKVH